MSQIRRILWLTLFTSTLTCRVILYSFSLCNFTNRLRINKYAFHFLYYLKPLFSISFHFCLNHIINHTGLRLTIYWFNVNLFSFSFLEERMVCCNPVQFIVWCSKKIVLYVFIVKYIYCCTCLLHQIYTFYTIISFVSSIAAIQARTIYMGTMHSISTMSTSLCTILPKHIIVTHCCKGCLYIYSYKQRC